MPQNSFLSRLAIALSLCLLLTAGCKRGQKKIAAQATDEDGATLASIVHMGDPKTATQLLKGFYDIEESWRWTAGQVALALRPPRNASIRGAVLHFKFVLPDAVLSRVKKMSITGAVNGTPLTPEIYTKSGEYDYRRDVDAKLLAGEAVNVEFTLDNFVPAGAIEERELGVIATSVGFEAK